MPAPLKIKVETVNGWTRVTFSGPINEAAMAPLRELAKQLGANCQFDMAQVTSVNSCGLAEWVHFISGDCAGKRVVLDRCPPAFVDCMHIAPAAFTGTNVRTVLVPQRCDGGHDSLRLHALDQGTKPAAPATCPTCAKAVRDVVPLDDYLAFVDEAS
jgi:ABC-type transporter Mla MlaB component